MITVNGRNLMGRALAGGPSWAGAVAVGISSTDAETTDTVLGLEFARVPVVSSLVSYEPTYTRITIHAELPAEITGFIKEIGIFSTLTDASNDSGSTVFAKCDSTESWEHYNGSSWDPVLTEDFDTGINWVGVDGLALEAGDGAHGRYRYAFGVIDMSKYSSSDELALGLYGISTNHAAGLTVKFITDNSNYFQHVLSSGDYQIDQFDHEQSRWTIGSMTSVGSPSWSSIQAIEFDTTGGTGGTTIGVDLIRIENTDSLNPDYTLVARSLSPGVWKYAGSPMEVETYVDLFYNDEIDI